MSPLRTALLIGVLALNTAHAGDTLGRLFLTPEQRHALDALRDPNAPRPATDLANNALPAGMQADRTVVLNGVVRRSRGPDVVWVNGTRASPGAGHPVQVRRGPDQHNRVTLENAGGSMARLKPGQFWDQATGRVADCYGCGATSKATDLVTIPPEATPAPAVSAPVNAPPASRP